MNATVGTVLAIFAFLIVTGAGAIALVMSTRGQYYKTLPARVEQLEEKDTKSYAEIQRLRGENSSLRAENDQIRDLITGHAEIKKLIEVMGLHDKEAAGRHTAILEALDDIFKAMKRRREEHLNG